MTPRDLSMKNFYAYTLIVEQHVKEGRLTPYHAGKLLKEAKQNYSTCKMERDRESGKCR